MKLSLPLLGPGGEPVDLWRTLTSHGVADLPPMELDPDDRSATVTIPLRGARPRTVRIGMDGGGHATIEVPGPPVGARVREEILACCRRILALDRDLSGFYALAAVDPELAWVTEGAGRMVRSATVFEDVVKTLCTTNCSWALTTRMVRALVAELGAPAPRAPEGTWRGRAFPTPSAIASMPEAFYRERVRAGYRAPHFTRLARLVLDGDVDLGSVLPESGLDDDEVEAILLGLPGIGPYAAAHVMHVVGRHSRLILDSWTRPTYARLHGRAKPYADVTIARRFRRYGPYAGLAFWLVLTKGWVPATSGLPAAPAGKADRSNQEGGDA
ncbi:MAG TPA: Fe-S cluster assembly protein HesB [Actinomycetota bacterium]|nr:Fe-S cluster assembly protein HesB [Actinomycetota bacterium]